MNTIETERLVRRIVATLKGEGDPAMAPKLAADFQAACASAALRLEQCRSMIDAGSSVQAIQLAETPPNLLDLVTVLEFRQADEWRQFCRTKNLPCPETLPARDVSALNQCYNKGISPQHPVYAAYREAVLGRKDEDALMALKSIVRLNPSDTNAVSELDRLDAKILSARLANLDQLLNADPEKALLELDSIESFGFKTERSGEVWRRGQLARSAKVLTDAEQMRDQGLLAETVALLDLLAQLQAEHSLTWPPGWDKRVESLQTWCRAEAAARQRDENFQSALGSVNQAVVLSEEKDTRAKKVTIPELKHDLEELHRRYRLVESFSRPVPDDLLQRFRKRSALLNQKIDRRTKMRLLLQSAAATACILLVVAIALALIGLRRANSLATELKKATAAHQVRTLELLLKQATSKSILPTPNLKSASAAAASEVTAQLAKLNELEAAFHKLPTQFTGITTMDQFVAVSSALSLVEQAHHALGPDLQSETEPKFAAFRNRWKSYCEEYTLSINQELDRHIAAAEATAGTLNETKELELFRSNIAAILPKLEQFSQNITTLSPFLKLRPELADRCQVLIDRLRKDQASLARLDAALATLARADKIADVAVAVADLATIDLKQSDYAQAARKARAVLALKDNPEYLSLALLLGADNSLGDSFLKAESFDLIPKKLELDSRRQFMEMARDYAVNGSHYRCRLHRDELLQSYEEWITDGPLQNDNSWHTTHAWVVTDQGPCEFGPKEYGGFNGRLMFSNRQPAYGVTFTALAGYTDVWTVSGFAKMADTRSMTYKIPPMKVLDGIMSATNASPIIRAYLLNELLKFMAAQPMESGFVFSPQVRSMPDRLRALGVEQITSGDWFVPSRIKNLQPKFATFFASYQGVSFFKQASGLLTAINRASKSGFTSTGYARPDGQPAWKTAPEDGLIWGLPATGDLPALLFIVKGGESRMVNKPLPLTPLLAYQGDLAAIINESGVNPDEPSFKGLLPPLFTAPVGASK